ncbi:MAG: 3-oxoacyl-ACP synthase [Planctomycetota bacterium]|nr:MAG: 3-oxoacyl-ACP synthase [Planctomycetota bacterium]
MPADSKRRVVITGLGLVSPLGSTLADFWAALSSGKSGVAPLSLVPPIDGKVVYGGECRQFTGDVADFGELDKDLKKAIRKALKMMCRESMMAVAAAQHAIVDAGLGGGGLDPLTTGVVFGSDLMLSPPEDFIDGMRASGVGGDGFKYEKWGDAGIAKMNPLWMLSYLPNMPASHIAIFNDLQAANNSLTMREVSSLAAIREAAQTIERGHAERMIAGATGTRIHSFKTVHALQTEQLANPELRPEEASRPFDARRTGMVCGEGAGAFVLEELNAALARGATIYGEVAGTGLSAVADAMLRPSGRTALENAARAALNEARAAPASIGHISAHAMGSAAGDREEAAAIGDVFGQRADQPPVVAAKSFFGNLGAGSGAVEMIASLLAVRHGTLFPTLNYTTPDPDCSLNVVADATPRPAGTSFLKLSSTPQGQAAALVVRRID